MRRRMAWVLALGLLVGGAAACGDDGEGDATVVDEGSGDSSAATDDTSAGDTTAADEGSSDSGDAGGANPSIDEFCDKVQELKDASDELAANPTDTDLQQKVTDLSAEVAQEGSELAAEIPTFTAEDAARFQGCYTDAG